jgi:ADP-ribose pyrophosphatase
MMNKLTAHQKRALEAYEILKGKWPLLFTRRNVRPIVEDPSALRQFARDHRVVLGVPAETRHMLFLVDLVESHNLRGGTVRHPYVRVVSRAQLEGGVSVVVLATIADTSLGRKGDVVLVEQERHALGTLEIELPRGFGERSLSAEANALRELARETGYEGDEAHLLGSMCVDSGLGDGFASFYHVPVVRHTSPTPESEEAITRVLLSTREEVWKAITSGAIRDGFTLQALALFERLRA